MTIILSIIGALLSLLLATISYFLKEFKKSVDNMSTSVNKLEVTAATYGEKFAANDKNNEVTIKRLDAHANQLKSHEIDITMLKTKIK